MEGCVPEILFILSHFPGTAIQCLLRLGPRPCQSSGVRSRTGTVEGGPSSYGEVAHLAVVAFRNRDSPSEKNNPLPLSSAWARLAKPTHPLARASKAVLGRNRWARRVHSIPSPRRLPVPAAKHFVTRSLPVSFVQTLVLVAFFAHPPDNLRFFLGIFLPRSVLF